MLDAARTLVVTGGARSLSMSAVAERLGAPSGSVYHRFPSRDHLAAELWLRTAECFQDRFVEQLDADGEPVEVAVAIARGVVDWTVGHPDDAAVLIEFRRRDFIGDDVPAPLAERAGALGRQVGAAFDRLAARLDRPVDMVGLAVAGIPYAAVRPALGAARPVPNWTADGVERAVRGLLR